jgi:hypothetical protein
VTDGPSTTLHPYLRPGSRPPPEDAPRLAEATVEHGWFRPADRTMVDLNPPVQWHDPSVRPAARRSMHTWEALDALLAAHSSGGEDGFLEVAAAFAADWFMHGAQDAPDDPATFGERAYRLAYLTQALAAHSDLGARAAAVAADPEGHRPTGNGPDAAADDTPDADTTDAEPGTDDGAATPRTRPPEDPIDLISRLHGAAVETATALDAWVRTGQGGIIAIAGLLALARRLDDVEELAVLAPGAADALVRFTTDAFTPDGVVRSQVPEEQRRILLVVAALVDSGLADRETLQEFRVGAEDALGWFVMPDGRLANFGRTPEHRVSSAYGQHPNGVRALPHLIAGPALLHAASAGRYGARPPKTSTSLREGGFYVVKEPWPSRQEGTAAAYLAMHTGRPGTATGRDGDLAIVWYDAGRRLLVEPGPGVVEADAGDDRRRSAWLRTPAAHNAVELVGSSFEGATGTPGRWGTISEAHWAEATLEGAEASLHRTVVLLPGSWLLLVDTVHAPNAESIRQWFHAPDDLGMLADPPRFTLLDADRPVAWVVPLLPADPLSPRRGVADPEPAGWWSPREGTLVPNWAFGYEAPGPSPTMATLLSVAGRPQPIARDGVWYAWQAGDSTIRVAVTDWGVVQVEEVRP